MGMDRFARDMISLREFFLIQPPPCWEEAAGNTRNFCIFLHCNKRPVVV